MDMSPSVYFDPRPSSRAEKRQRKSLAPAPAPGSEKKEELASTPPESIAPAAEKRTRRKQSSRVNSKSVSLGEDSEDDVKPIVKAKRPQEEESGARKRVKKEDEDVKPEIDADLDEDVKPRRSSRACRQDAIPSIDLDASDHEDGNDIKPRRDSRSRAPSARAPTAETDEEKKRIKEEKKRIREDKKYEEALRNHENFVAWPPVPGVDADSFSILDPDTWQDPLEVTKPEIAALRQIKPFHYDVLRMGSGPCFMARNKGKRPESGYTHDIHGLRQELNLDMTVAGRAFVQTSPARPFDPKVSLKPEEDSAMFCRLPTKEPERYRPFGMYRRVWQGRAKDGEYAKLSLEKKETIFSIFREYLSLENWFTRLVFKDCYLEVDGGRQHISKVGKPQKDTLLRSCLESNRGLTMYWGLWIYTGDNKKEVADCGQRRAFRYKEAKDPKPAQQAKGKKGKKDRSRRK